MTKAPITGTCAFCGKEAPLRVSHVLPAFVYRWLKGRGTGHIRHTDDPNRRVQDGLKLAWLCAECEGLFGEYETAFATKLFHPWHAGNQSIRYDRWLLKFCVSVSWRVLRFARGRNKTATYSDEQRELMDRAEARWRGFLNDEVPHPGEFEQHLLVVDQIESTTVQDLPTNINRFMMGAVTLDIVGSSRSVMTFAKLGRFIIFGIIQKGPDPWEGTKVHVKDGVIKPGKFVIPAGLLDLFKDKAEHAAAAMSTISERQQAKIEANVIANLDKFIGSDHIRSMLADAELFGEDAVLRKG